MNSKNNIRIVPLVSILLVISCLFGSSQFKAPGTSNENIPLYSTSQDITLAKTDQISFIEDHIGHDYLLFESSFNLSWTKDLGKAVQEEFDNKLPGENWRIEQDWINPFSDNMSLWKKGDLGLLILIIDNLNTEKINQYNKSYGIDGPIPGSTMIFMYVIDTSKPLPDLTATFEKDIDYKTSTAQSIAIAQTATKEFENANQESTNTAEAQKKTSTFAANATSTAELELRQLIKKLSDDFNSTQLSENWKVYRPDPTKWDLSNKPGMLHIIGSFKRNSGYLNIFAMRVTYSDIEVIAKIDTSEIINGWQKVWINFTPDDYGKDFANTIELGFQYINYDGHSVYMASCNGDCIMVTSVGKESVENTGTIYLKLVRRGNIYSGYYSQDGKTWIIIGEEKNFKLITDQFTFGAGVFLGNQDFDTYFDFIHYLIPSEDITLST